jgi:F-type H+-transporting ATPase subunit epsilon
MADTFQLEIVTPEREMVRTEAEEIQIPGKNGYLGILPGHAPLITELAAGEIIYRSGAGTERLACASGFAEVLPNKVTILAETAERPKDIDVPRAEQALRKGEERLEQAETPEAVDRALDRIQRAQVRIDVGKNT